MLTALSTLLPSAMLATTRRRGDPIRFSTSTMPMVALETSEAISSISYSKLSPLAAPSCCRRSSITRTQRSTDLNNLADRVNAGTLLRRIALPQHHARRLPAGGDPALQRRPAASRRHLRPHQHARRPVPGETPHAGPACWTSGAPSAASTRPPKPPSTFSAASGNST